MLFENDHRLMTLSGSDGIRHTYMTAVSRTHHIYGEIVTTQPLWMDPECHHLLFLFLKSEISPHPPDPPH